MQPKILFVPAPRRVMTEEEIDRALAGLEEEHPVLLALQQMLAVRFAVAASSAADPALSERAAGHAGGRIEEVAALREELFQRRRRAAERK
jgi:hypothetical protein